MTKIPATERNEFLAPREPHFLSLFVKENGPKNDLKLFQQLLAFDVPSDAVKIIPIQQIFNPFWGSKMTHVDTRGQKCLLPRSLENRLRRQLLVMVLLRVRCVQIFMVLSQFLPGQNGENIFGELWRKITIFNFTRFPTRWSKNSVISPRFAHFPT